MFYAELSLKRYCRGPRSQEVAEEGDYFILHCHHQNDSCIKMDSDESRFNVSLVVSNKVRKTV